MAQSPRWQLRWFLCWCFALFLLTGVLIYRVFHPKPEKDRAHGYGDKPIPGPRPKLPAPQFFTHPPQTDFCEICLTNPYDWDPCFAGAKAKCQQTVNKHCVPIKNGSGMLGNYTACMCSQPVATDALTRVSIGPNVGDQCLLQACESRDNVCGDGCCRAVNGTEQICGKTMRLWKPTEANPKPHRISVCYPFNWTKKEKHEHEMCRDNETIEKDCYSATWKPCCSGEASCSKGCHIFLWNALWKETLLANGVMVGLFLLVALLGSVWFWRLIIERSPETLDLSPTEVGKASRKVIAHDVRVCLVLGCSFGLRTAGNDARAVFAKFAKGYDHYILLLDQELTAGTIRDAVLKLIGECSGYQWPLIVVYYAGHGRTRHRVHEVLGYKTWLDLQDTFFDIFSKMHTMQGMASIGLKNAPEPVKNAFVLLVLDCCRRAEDSRSLVPGEDLHDELRPRRKVDQQDSSNEMARAARIGYIWSAKRGQAAVDQTREGNQHSPFTANFLDFLDDDISLCDLFFATKEKVYEEVGLSIDQKDLADNITLAPLSSPPPIRPLQPAGSERSGTESLLTRDNNV